ncbi:MAG TPA: complex I subunit 1 family protein [Bryobacteraceae bacterium]|jgi:NADH-quinone oxidoreductase subunit H|nr:complex I subunit 1 family protein [Bryobacteraceae bacterium]
MNFLILSIIKAAVVAFVLLTALAYLQWLERKVLAHIQLRVGPRRVGPHGLLQPLADVIKLITKEDMMPSHVNKVFWFLAPFIAVLFALIPIAVIPFGTELALPAIDLGPIHIPAITTAMQLTDLNIGVLFILGISGLGVYGVVLAGWSSNNKYSLLGGLRSSAQMISYELPMALAIAAPLLVLNTLSFRGIVDGQAGFFFGFLPKWTIFQVFPLNIISFILFIIAAFAETNRVPFDLPEAENELVAGFHTEYGSMKFAAFFMAEYCNMVTVSCVATLLFLGGWHPPFPAAYGSSFLPSLVMAGAGILCFLHAASPARPFDRITLPVVGVAFFALAGLFLIPAVALPLMPIIWFSAKALVILFVYIWVRGTLPRFRYDQLMRFAWTFMFPVAVTNLFLTGLVVALS